MNVRQAHFIARQAKGAAVATVFIAGAATATAGATNLKFRTRSRT